MNIRHGRIKLAVVASVLAALILAPSIFSAPKFDLPWSLSFVDFLRSTSPIASSSLSVWPESTAAQRIELVGTREILDGDEAECVRMPPGPESYKVTYFTWFEPGSPLSGQINLVAHRPEDVGRTVAIRLVRQAAYAEEPFLDRSVEVRHALTPTWTTLDFQLLASQTANSTMLTSLAVVNPSTSSELQVCASHAAVWPFRRVAKPHFTNPAEWIFAETLPAYSRWLSLGAFALLAGMATYGASLLLHAFRRIRANYITLGLIALLAVLTAPAILGIISGVGQDATRYQGITGHPNIMAASAVATVIAIWAWTQNRPVFIASLPVGTLLVLATGSRAGLVAMLIAGVGLMFSRRWEKRRFGTLALTALGIGIFVIVILTYVDVTRLQSLTVTRPQIWSAALDLMIERPLGWGYGMAGPALTAALGPSSGRTVAHAHNLFLNIGLELGVLALLAVLVVTAYLFAQLSRSHNFTGLAVLVTVVILCIVDVTLVHVWVYGPLLIAIASPKFSSTRAWGFGK